MDQTQIEHDASDTLVSTSRPGVDAATTDVAADGPGSCRAHRGVFG